jgi:hypothetical protein
VQTEDIGDDAVEATRLGLKNNDRIAKILLPATTRLGEDYERLREMHGELLIQRAQELFHVVGLVGGVEETDYHGGRGGDVFKPVAKERQAKAIRFLVDEGFRMPTALYSPELMNRMYPDGIINRMTALSQGLLGELLSSSRIRRMLDNEAANGSKAYSVEQMVGDLTKGVWKETGDAVPKVDVYRRTLQRTFLETMDKRINGSTQASDLKLIAKSALRSLAKELDVAAAKAKDKPTALHFVESRKEIELILAGKTKTQANPFGDFFGMFFLKDNARHAGCFTHPIRKPHLDKD